MLSDLLEKNKAWAKSITDNQPDFFKKLAKQQNPKYLWIGCADSRVPATQIVDLEPGEIFVHRNISNLVMHADLNCASVIQYAVEALKVEHIIVCGHYNCGGVAAAYRDDNYGLADYWLRMVRNIYHKHKEKFAGKNDNIQINSLCEINVLEQVTNICTLPLIKKAWKSGQNLSIHGCIYDLQNGLLQDLKLSVSGISQVPEAFNFLKIYQPIYS